MNKNDLCDRDRIELFLEQKLSGEEQAAFESHLTDCDDCCRRLESSAASEDLWRRSPGFPADEQLPDGDGRADVALDSMAGEEAFSSQATVLNLLAPTDDDRMLGRWGTYEVVGVVGTGGMGVVLKALDTALNRYVAIKILAPHLGSSGAARKRFSREAQASAAVVHDNVIEIYGVAEAAGLPYLVMPYVRGPSLQRRLDDEGPLAVVEILRVGMQAAAGLAAAHAQGLVHRDVKPANILLADGIERVKLTDFGLARAADDASLTKTGIIAGTPQYMSPEQARGEAGGPAERPVQPWQRALCDVYRPPAVPRRDELRRAAADHRRRAAADPRDQSRHPRLALRHRRPGSWRSGPTTVSNRPAKSPRCWKQCLAHVQQPTAVPLPPYSPLPPGEGQGVRAECRPEQACAVPAEIGFVTRLSRNCASLFRPTRSRNTLILGTVAMLTLIGISLFTAKCCNVGSAQYFGQLARRRLGPCHAHAIRAGRVHRHLQRHGCQRKRSRQDRAEMVADRAPLQRHVARRRRSFRRSFRPSGGPRDSRRR